MSKLIVLYGIPGAGKTTVAEELSTRLGCFHLDTDAIAAPIYAQYEHSTIRSAFEASFAAALGLIRLNSQPATTTVLSGAFAAQSRWDALSRLASGGLVRVIAFELYCPHEVALSRLTRRQPVGHIDQHDAASIMRLARSLEALRLEISTTRVDSTMPPHLIADTICELIQ